jgi:hypothetical protein
MERAMAIDDYTSKNLSRFWSKVDKSGGDDACWTWTASCNQHGYGRIKWRNKLVQSHRLAWQLKHGDIPEGLFVCHHCDNPKCCNPKHLFLGTNKDNQADMHRKGRGIRARGLFNGSYTHPERRARGERHWSRLYPDKMPKGERNSQAKLTDDDVRRIRTLYASGGITQRQLAVQFGVDQQVIWAIVNRKRWSHVA